ncbi:hypothetical protein LX36DRAFT_651852 [Colletotrichum falcatum]|nr:hypothetical protein LX36DRAFT_651852 [Colletotrichum falcatum]
MHLLHAHTPYLNHIYTTHSRPSPRLKSFHMLARFLPKVITTNNDKKAIKIINEKTNGRNART